MKKIPTAKSIEVFDFIDRFTDRGRREEVIITFTCGCCYWFAKILSERFSNSNAIIVYDDTDNHFGCKIEDRVYDITGDVTDKYDWGHWPIRDYHQMKNIIRNCIDF